MVSPSLLSADFMNLQRDIDMINESDADWLHLDIMDGVFVPNISFGFSVIDVVAKHLKKPMDVHFMTTNPDEYIDHMASIGAMMMNFHVETRLVLTDHKIGTSSVSLETLRPNVGDIIRHIHNAGMKAGITISPNTPVGTVRPYINDVEMVLVMGVYPGFGGQKFIEATIDRVRELRQMITDTGSHALIEVDGGVQAETAPRLVEAGCDVLVSGSYVFKASDPKAVIRSMRSL